MKRCVIIIVLSIDFICACSQTLQNPWRNVLPPEVSGEFDTIFDANQRFNDSGLVLVEKGLSQYPDSLAWFKLLRAKAILLAKSHRHDEIPAIVSPAIHFAEKRQMNSALVNLYDLLAVGQTYRGEYSDALRSYHKIIPLLYQDSIKRVHPEVFNNIGMLYYKIRDSRTAIRYYREANGIASDARCLLNIALAYLDVDSVHQSLVHIRQAEAEMRSTRRSEQDLIMLHFVYGKLYLDQNPDSAEARFTKSLRLSRVAEDRRMEAENLVSLARIHLDKQYWQEAQAFLLLAERISLEENMDEILLEVLRQSMITYTSLSDKQRLVECQRRFTISGSK